MIFIHIALAVKPLEVRLVHAVHGPTAASVHWTAFGARNGVDMCTEPNLEWARSFFNSIATCHMGIMLNELRHVWIGIGRRVSDNFADRANDDLSRIIRNASARQSHHNAHTERRKYAGQDGSILGHEAGDRQLYRALSENFNREVFGCGASASASASASVQVPAPAPVSALAAAAASASAPRFPISISDQPPPSVPSFLDPRLPVSASAPAPISVAASAQQASALGQQQEIRNERTGRVAPVPCEDPRAVDWSDEAYARDTSFALRAIAQDFPGFQLGQKVPATETTPRKTFCPIDFRYTRGPNLGEIKFRVPLDIIDYGTSFESFCTPEFLPSLSAEGHTKLMDTAAMRECFRCFFLHLAVELGVHPVALQVVPRRPSAAPIFFPSLLPLPSSLFLFLQFVCRERCRVLSQIIAERTAADEESDLHFFSEAVDSVLVRRVTENENNFVDAQFLQAAWPPELDNVRLLIVFRNHLGTLSTHNWNLFTPRADAQTSIEGGQEWTGRDVILNLKDGHFTILRHQDPDNHHPIQDLLDKMLDADVTSDVLNHPGERKLLHLESVLVGEPDRTRCMSVAQLHAQQLALPGPSFATESVEEIVQALASGVEAASASASIAVVTLGLGAATESVNDLITGQNRLPEIGDIFGCIAKIDRLSSACDCQDQGQDLVEMTPAHTAAVAVNETPRTNARHHPIPASVDPTSFSSTKAEVLATLKRNQICLLHQKPGFGKTRIIMELLSRKSFLIIFVPTKVLRAQVTALTAISYTNHS
jgi:hypothetical protein